MYIYVYMYVYIYIYIYAYTFIYIYIYIFADDRAVLRDPRPAAQGGHKRRLGNFAMPFDLATVLSNDGTLA